ncbi:cache domain-containing protein [Chloroflexota bacterium]
MKRTISIGITIIVLLSLLAVGCSGQKSEYQYKDTEKLVTLVREAAALVEKNGDKAFPEFKTNGSKWWQGGKYIFVYDTEGNLLVHPDPELEGKNQLGLKDPNGKPIVKWFINEASRYQGETEGWYHYLWPKPGEIFPTWKTTYVNLATAPSGKIYIVCSGVYNMSMERVFAEDVVKKAMEFIESEGKDAFDTLRDPASEFLFQDTYVFVVDQDGISLVNPNFSRYVEGKNLMDLKDSDGKYITRAMFDLLKTQESGWVDYKWPKPGQTTPSKKSTFVAKAKLGDTWVLVGCGVYLE